MSNQPENDLFNLDNLFAPAWAKEPTEANRYAKYEGRDETSDRGERRGGRPGFGGPRREGGPRPPRGPGGAGGPGGRFGGPRPGGDRRPAGRGGFRRDDRAPQGERRERPEPQPLPEVTLALVPDANGVDLLARQIKMTGRAYPLFQIALMILEKPERHAATFAVKKNAEGQPVQPLFGCALDESLWLSEDDVVKHILSQHLATFYQAERTQSDPPKGKYTFVAQCGMSGVILGPPNHHDYQKKLQELHAQRFPRLPFDAFKARVKIVKDEAVVAKWIEDQSWKTEYICLNIPDAPKLGSMEDVENHFRAVHAANIVKPVETITISGKTCRNLRCPGLARLYRIAVEDQRRFPLQIATVLSQQFAQHGLQFFKVNKTVTHVWVARPKYLDLETTPVSDGVRRIVDFINAHAKCTRRDLVEALAPTPAAATPAPAPDASAEGAAPAAQSAKPEPAPEPTPEQTAVVSDLHWLIHQGHVIEFATTGFLETAKKPAPKPPKPAKAEAKPAGTTPAPAAAATVEAKPEDAVPTPAEAQAAGETTAPVAEPAEPLEPAATAEPVVPAPDPAPTQS
ncbi:MAG TPA: hypothetical protein VFV96_06805 [Verrucomicrobiae bacterium]|nr:hypothetical protein [Verrucomicrobiae bacterium]